MDTITVHDLRVHCVLGVDQWERAKRQPLHISFSISADVDTAGEFDQLTNSTSYSALAKTVTELAESSSFHTLEALAIAVASTVLNDDTALEAKVTIKKPRALLHAASSSVEVVRRKGTNSNGCQNGVIICPSPLVQDVLRINDMVVSAIIGVNPWERAERQNVIVNLSIFYPDGFPETGPLSHQHDYRAIARLVEEYVQESRFKTVEALCHHIARLCIERCSLSMITVRVEKPSALVFAKTAGVEITRDRAWLQTLRAKQNTPALIPREKALTLDSNNRHQQIVYIALGSNLGDRAGYIHDALRSIISDCMSCLLDTSFLYETVAMYTTDQPMFLNAVCKIATSHDPHNLLKMLKNIEEQAGRTNTGRNGPRPIDLDILLYDHMEYQSDTLVIPHPRIQEREFVLRPLCDIAPDLRHPVLFRTMAKLLVLLLHSSTEPATPMYRVYPISSSTIWTLSQKTYIMGILNVTPDSFSDGGNYVNVTDAVEHAKGMIAAGADIIDIGGQSTRPHAQEITIEEEIDRVIPIIHALRKDIGLSIPISIDTYRSQVAQAAITAGANMINDVSGGSRDKNMLTVMAILQTPVCLMHMRGDAQSMNQLTNYVDNDIMLGIAQELEQLVERALRAGIPRWKILIDPGIGFAKDMNQNYDIVRHLRHLNDGTLSHTLASLPLLVGPSRKRFIHAAIASDDSMPIDVATDLQQRVWGTAAAVTACVAGGADIVRVHDVAEMSSVVKVADKVWRRL